MNDEPPSSRNEGQAAPESLWSRFFLAGFLVFVGGVTGAVFGVVISICAFVSDANFTPGGAEIIFLIGVVLGGIPGGVLGYCLCRYVSRLVEKRR